MTDGSFTVPVTVMKDVAVIQLRAAAGAGPYTVTARSTFDSATTVLSDALGAVPVTFVVPSEYRFNDAANLELLVTSDGPTVHLEYTAQLQPRYVVPMSMPSVKSRVAVEQGSESWLFAPVSALQLSVQLNCSSASSSATATVFATFASLVTGTGGSALPCDGRQMAVALTPTYHLAALTRSSSNESVLFELNYQLAPVTPYVQQDFAPVAYHRQLYGGLQVDWFKPWPPQCGSDLGGVFIGPGLDLYRHSIAPPEDPSLQDKWFARASWIQKNQPFRLNPGTYYAVRWHDGAVIAGVPSLSYSLGFFGNIAAIPGRMQARKSKTPVIWRQEYSLLATLDDGSSDPDFTPFRAYVQSEGKYSYAEPGDTLVLPAPLASADFYAYGPKVSYSINAREMASITANMTNATLLHVGALHIELGEGGGQITLGMPSVEGYATMWTDFNCWPLHESLLSNSNISLLRNSFQSSSGTIVSTNRRDGLTTAQFRAPFVHCMASTRPADVVVKVKRGLPPDPTVIIIAVVASVVVVAVVVVVVVVVRRRKRARETDAAVVEGDAAYVEMERSE
eukprot:PLAT11555.1.p1 GENE.PLAT11555.1~~PLAT11555.1.p1  ORF type:complete len:643 (-),score=48.19 PLAT11555.1:163-1857(-)